MRRRFPNATSWESTLDALNKNNYNSIIKQTPKEFNTFLLKRTKILILLMLLANQHYTIQQQQQQL